VAEFLVDGSDLILHLRGREQVLGFHFDIRIPLLSIQSSTAVAKPWLALRGRRMAGTAMRGVIALGTWRHGAAGYDFNVVRNQLEAVQVDVNSGRFSRFIVCVPDDVNAQGEADRIADAAGIARAQPAG
jgi:hypothetical protein